VSHIPAESPCGNKPNLRQMDPICQQINTVFKCVLVPVPQRTKKLCNKKYAVSTVSNTENGGIGPYSKLNIMGFCSILQPLKAATRVAVQKSHRVLL
jgi:hypothetical protein